VVLDRAIAGYSAGSGATPFLAQIYLVRSQIQILAGDAEAAIPDRLTALAIHRKLDAPDAPEIAEALELLGNAQEAAHHLDDARRSYDDALAIRARHPDHPELAASAETGLAILLVDAGKPAAALPRLEHALALATANTDPESNDLADARVAVARALLALHRDRPRALSLLRDTRAALRPGIDTAIERKEIDRLLASAGDKP